MVLISIVFGKIICASADFWLVEQNQQGCFRYFSQGFFLQKIKVPIPWFAEGIGTPEQVLFGMRESGGYGSFATTRMAL